MVEAPVEESRIDLDETHKPTQYGKQKQGNEKEIDKGKWVAAVFTLLTDAAAVTIGILARIYFTKEGEDPESILVYRVVAPSPVVNDSGLLNTSQ